MFYIRNKALYRFNNLGLRISILEEINVLYEIITVLELKSDLLFTNRFFFEKIVIIKIMIFYRIF